MWHQQRSGTVTVRRFCELCDERAAVRMELDRGVLLEEAVATSKGEVIGVRVVANPACGMLRSIDKALDALADRLGVNPASRSRMGLQMTTSERQAAEVARMLEGRYKAEEDDR
jgi:phage terminase small subunit